MDKLLCRGKNGQKSGTVILLKHSINYTGTL